MNKLSGRIALVVFFSLLLSTTSGLASNSNIHSGLKGNSTTISYIRQAAAQPQLLYFPMVLDKSKNHLLTFVSDVYYNDTGSQEPDEYVEILTTATWFLKTVNWTVSDNQGNTFTFPSSILTAGHACRIYTNQYHPEWCGFNFQSETPIWDNTGDCVTLRDWSGNLIDQYCY